MRRSAPSKPGKLVRLRFIRGTPGRSRSNLMFEGGAWPKRSGKFPPSHPCAANPEPFTFGAPAPTDDPLGRFRARGYGKASCFPEGDGITFDVPDDRTDDQVIADARECFGVEVRS